MSPDKICMFLINLSSGNAKIQKLTAKRGRQEKVNTLGLN